MNNLTNLLGRFNNLSAQINSITSKTIDLENQFLKVATKTEAAYQSVTIDVNTCCTKIESIQSLILEYVKRLENVERLLQSLVIEQETAKNKSQQIQSQECVKADEHLIVDEFTKKVNDIEEDILLSMTTTSSTGTEENTTKIKKSNRKKKE